MLRPVGLALRALLGQGGESSSPETGRPRGYAAEEGSLCKVRQCRSVNNYAVPVGAGFSRRVRRRRKVPLGT